MIKRAIVGLGLCLTLLVTFTSASQGGINLLTSDSPAHLMLQVIKRQEGKVIRIFIQNTTVANITATFSLSLVNMKPSRPVPFTATFSPHQMVEAFSLTPIANDVWWNYTLTNQYTIGSSLAIHNDQYVYQLPYAAGQAFYVSQAYHGAFSHQGAESYAIDWRMPEGTPVHAAREGIVVDTKSDSTQGGPSKKYESLANYILIQHADGTIGNYAHLQTNGVNVKIGQKVKTGELIGWSGNTGFSNGPHLHFCVFKTKNGRERASIPVKFQTGNGTVTLLAGETYYLPSVFLATVTPPNRAVSY